MHKNYRYSDNRAYLLHRLLIVFSYTMEQAMGTLEKTLLVLCLAAVFISTTKGRLLLYACMHGDDITMCVRAIPPIQNALITQ